MTDPPILACMDCGAVSEEGTALLLQQQGDIHRLEMDLRNKRAMISRLRNEQYDKLISSRLYEPALRVLRHWQEQLHPTARELEGRERLQAVQDRLKGGYGPEDLTACIDGYVAFPYVTEGGRARYGTKAQRRVDVELIFGDAKHVDAGLRMKAVAEEMGTTPIAEHAAEQHVPAGEMAAAAVKMARHGWHVFPINEGDKTPANRNGLLGATNELDRVQACWERYPTLNIGVRCGIQSKIIVLDVDPRHGGDDSLAELEAHHGRLPKTLSVVTPSGGQHFYFAHPGFTTGNTAGYPGVGLDIRGDGGYVLAPPSRTPDGVYELDEPAAITPLPDWLIEKLRARRDHLSKMTAGEWVDEIMARVDEGGRNNALARITGKFITWGIPTESLQAMVMTQNLAHCKPPLPAPEVKSIVDSIIRRHESERAKAIKEGRLNAG